MTPTPLNKLRFSWHDHKSVLRWLALLYRRPRVFAQNVEECLTRRLAIMTYLTFLLHLLPYLVVISILSRVVIFGMLFGPRAEWYPNRSTGLLYWHLSQMVLGITAGIGSGVLVGIVFAIAFGIAVGTASAIAFAIAVGIGGGAAAGIAFGIAVGTAGGIAFGAAGGIAFGTAYGIAGGIAFGIAYASAGGIALGIAYGSSGKVAAVVDGGIAVGIVGGVAVGIVGGAAAGITGGISFLVAYSRLYYAPACMLFALVKRLGRYWRYHPVAWDEACLLPVPGLQAALVRYTEYAPQEGRREIERLIAKYPSQRMAALRARVTLLAREAGKVDGLALLQGIAEQLPEGERGFLRQTSRVRELTNEIAAIQLRLNTLDRPVLREPIADLLSTKIVAFQHKIGGFREPLTTEFLKASANWLKLAERQLEQVKAVTTKRSTPQVFHAGDPVDKDNEAFVYRTGVTGEIEKQLLLSTGCPGLIIYGRRRVGKSTVLRNLRHFLPADILTATTSMQHPEACVSLAGWISVIAKALRATVREMREPKDDPMSLTSLFSVLSGCNENLEKKRARLLLAFDEYENIDMGIKEGVFPEPLLATIRESIQYHRRITWVFCGAHEITELRNAPWTSYLVSARTIEVNPFTPDETRLLLTDPLKHSSLWDKDSPKRPRFEASFWGQDGIDQIHYQAGGWPHLVQLVAETLVDLMNDEEATSVYPELMERALDRAIVRGHNVFYELIYRECTLSGEREYIARFRDGETQHPPEDEQIRTSLRRRLLVEEENGLWRLRVPLMSRWLRQRG